jgi:pimeloyl-ACP methyl ester carboxylesterase
MEETTERIQGRAVSPAQVEWLREWIAAQPAWSRKQIARELCAAWEWRDQAGRVKDFAARSFLLKLAGQGRIALPARFIVGGRSHYVRPEDEAAIRHHFPAAEIITMADAGHNPHMEKRAEFVRAVVGQS